MEKSFNKKYLNKDIFLVLFVNLFLANQLPHGSAIFDIWFACVLILGVKNLDKLSLYKQFLLVFIGLIPLFVCMARIVCLPILYTYLEKYSKEKVIQKFIYNLKNKRLFRIKLLLLIETPIWICTFIINNGKNVLEYFIIFIIFIVFFDLFGSYLVLFLWWKLRGELKNIDK